MGRLSPDGCVDDAYGEMGPVKGGVFSVRVTHGEVWLLIRRSLQGETDGGHGSAERLPPAKAGALVR